MDKESKKKLILSIAFVGAGILLYILGMLVTYL